MHSVGINTQYIFSILVLYGNNIGKIRKSDAFIHSFGLGFDGAIRGAERPVETAKTMPNRVPSSHLCTLPGPGVPR